MRLRLLQAVARDKRENRLAGFERCVLCHKPIKVCMNVPISERQWYIQCVGQLCEECYQSIQEERWME